mgnify:CR=1 FL=1
MGTGYARRMTRSHRQAIWPVLHYEDTNRAHRFLTEAFGFTTTVAVRDEDGVIVHAEMSRPEGGSLVFGLAGRGDGVHSDLPTGCSACYVATDRVDPIHDRAKQAGAEIIQPPQDTAFGTGVPTRAFTARDPEGNRWTFGTYTGAA